MLAPFEALQDEIFCVTCNVLPLRLGKFDILLADILVNFLDISAIEWSQTRKKLVGDDA